MQIFQTVNWDFSGLRLVLNHTSHKPKAQRKMCSALKWRAEVPKSASKVIIMHVVIICFQMHKQILCECHYETHLFGYTENFTTQTESFEIKSDIFYISAQNIDCGYSLEPPHQGGSNEYPQSMFLSRNKENNVYSCKPQFYYIKVGFKGVKTI